MATKMTKRDYFNTLRELSEVQANPALIGFIDHEIELLERKNSGEHKPTKTQTANEAVKASIFEEMVTDHPYTITEMTKTLDCVSGFTPQKVSALIRQMIAEKRVTRSEVKRVAYFTAVK